MLVLHDDAVREYAYGPAQGLPDTKVGTFPQALYDKAIAWGCESVSEPRDLDRWPVTVAFIKDPDGYLIELLQNHQGVRPSMR